MDATMTDRQWARWMVNTSTGKAPSCKPPRCMVEPTYTRYKTGGVEFKQFDGDLGRNTNVRNSK